ncbi:MAG: phage virion morphogenesis protein [Bacteroidales bacterium]|jgi:phage gpG-like protein|nr:phage virion morphogenesis protein [Bacteroidales bacterium]
MTPQQAANLVKKQQKEIENLFNNHMPVKVGEIAKSHFKQNFRDGGFDSIGTWKKTKRQRSGSRSSSANYSPLTSGRDQLMGSINYQVGKGVVTIYNNVEYAAIHNYGGTTHPKVTPKLKRFAWAKFFEETGIKKGMTKKERRSAEQAAGEEAKMWKSIALTKKQHLNVKIPKRQFLGESQILNKKIEQEIVNQMNKILKF